MMTLSIRIAIATALVTSTTFAENHGEAEDDNACDATKCIKNDVLTGFVDAADPFCCAGVSGTKCSDGYHYSVGGDCYQGIAFATCCTKDPVPGEFDFSTCTESKCTSPDAFFGTDCYAGTRAESCSCSDGYFAKETGITSQYLGTTYTGYTCCPPDLEGTDGLSCGDHDSSAAAPSAAVDMAAITTVAAAVALFF